MQRKQGEKLLREFAAEDARDMRRYARGDSSYDRTMEAYHKGRYNGYKQAISIMKSKCLWREG